MPLDQFDIALRVAGAVQLVLLGAVFGWRAHGPLRWVGPVFALSVASYLWCPVVYGAWGAHHLRVPLPYLFCVSVAAWFWMFSRALLDERFRPSLVHWSAIAAMVAVSLARELSVGPEPQMAILTVAPQLISIAIIVVALVQAARERTDDLMPARRRFRDGLTILVGAYALGIVVIEVFLRGARAAPWVEAANAGAILVLSSGAILVLVGIRADVLPQEGRRADPEDLSANDRGLADALIRAMEEDKAYREEGLTIGRLAERLGCPEHRLRPVINRGLGHRNFARFVNGYRLAEAKARLVDPSDRAPVLTIALDAGFGSIGPFNRAFKEATGLTPVEYRRRHAAPEAERKT